MPPHRSQLLWELTRRILGVSRPILELFLAKFWNHGSTPSWSKRVEFPKCWPFWQKRTVFRFFQASSVTIIAMKNLKSAFESSWNALSCPCHQISAKVNSLGYTGHQSWKKNTIFKQNILSWITFFLIKIQQSFWHHCVSLLQTERMI